MQYVHLVPDKCFKAENEAGILDLDGNLMSKSNTNGVYLFKNLSHYLKAPFL